MRLKDSARILAAGTAAFLCCSHPRPAAVECFAVRCRGAPVGWLTRVELGQRRDAAGPFVVTGYRLHLRRWADGRGVVSDEMTLAAARRPGRPAYYVAGRWSGGEFRYRLGDSWRSKTVDEFGNVAEGRGTRPPSFLTFEGVPLPLPTAPRKSHRNNLTSLELTSGRTSTYRGRGAGGCWSGRGDDDYVQVRFGADGAVVSYVDGTGYGTGPADGPPRPCGFLYQKPAVAYLPVVLPPRPTAVRLRLPVAARTSRPAGPGDLTRAGQSFDGLVAGKIINGTFAVEPSRQGPLESAAGDLAPSSWGDWPHIQGRGELERLAASFRADGKSVRFVAGLGVFGGNLLAGYDWLEVDGRTVAAPGRPMPQLRVALATSADPATVTKFALAGEPEIEGRGARPIAGEIPGLKKWAELIYKIYCRGAPAGEVAAWYEKPAAGPPGVILYGEILGGVVEAASFGELTGGSLQATREPHAPLAAFITLGAAVAVPAEDAKPPYELCLPAAGGRPARVTWQGFKPVVVGGERRLCRVFRLEPGAFRAYYTYDGVLVALEWHNLAARLASLPARPTGASFEALPAPEPAPPEPPAPSPAAGEGESE